MTSFTATRMSITGFDHRMVSTAVLPSDQAHCAGTPRLAVDDYQAMAADLAEGAPPA